jgi:hypothetical protein
MVDDCGVLFVEGRAAREERENREDHREAAGDAAWCLKEPPGNEEIDAEGRRAKGEGQLTTPYAQIVTLRGKQSALREIDAVHRHFGHLAAVEFCGEPVVEFLRRKRESIETGVPMGENDIFQL